MLNKNHVLISNGLLPVAAFGSDTGNISVAALGTVVSNLAYYGFAPSSEVLRQLSVLSDEEAGALWQDIKPALENITGADRKMDRHVVYKNFPREVLEMSQARYWVAQILMYMDVPNEYFTETEAERKPMGRIASLKVLGAARENSLNDIMNSLKAVTARWTEPQREQVVFLYGHLPAEEVSPEEYGFRENGVRVAALAFMRNERYFISTATDVLRMAAALSEGDLSLRTPGKFRNFTRSERRRLLCLMESMDSDKLVGDFFMRPEVWKRFLSRLHPGDFNMFARVDVAYDKLYRDDFTSFGAAVERGLKEPDRMVLELLSTRPGEFMRRLHKAYAVFEGEAVTAFLPVIGKLSTMQLVKLDGYLRTVNNRARMIYAPRGNWTRAQIADNKKSVFPEEHVSALRIEISRVIRARLAARYPEGFNVDSSASLVKIQTGDRELAPYGRGTVFEIPEGMTFLRSASYWEQQSDSNVWFDNGWNFFGENWADMGAVCWNSTDPRKGGCVFSGDPTNSQELKGRGCQMIDLNLDLLEKQGVRYAVWNILCFSHIPFSKATDVLATLQWGDNPQKGGLYEPSRAQMVFPLKGDNLTKYVAYVDVRERKLVYIDANLYGSVSSAVGNGQHLSEKLPAFLEYVNSMPTVADLFSHGEQGTIPVLFTDEGISVSGNAWVFSPRNPDNAFTAIDLSEVLDDTSDPGPAVMHTSGGHGFTG